MTNPQEYKQRLAFWRNKKKKLQKEAEQIQDIINSIESMCDHEYEDGRSAIVEDAPFHPASQRYCKICGKYF